MTDPDMLGRQRRVERRGDWLPYRYYLLLILTLITAHNYVDRMALGMMLQSIKRDLQLTDTQLGFLTGLSFFVFYSLMGIPLARWADRGNRVTIVMTTTALWSAAVALCGAATSFAQLLLIRIGVAVGEAGCVPTAHSLIADHFDRAERPKAVALYKLGNPLCLVAAYFGAGWLNELYGWRVTFVLIGIPGIALALLARATLREPRCTSPMRRAPPPANQLPLKAVCSVLWSIPSYVHLLIAYAVLSFFSFGIAQWQPAFFARSYGVSSGALGSWLALVMGGSGLIGIYVGGTLADRFAAGNEPLQLKWMAAAYCAFGLFSAAVYLAPTFHLALLCLALGNLGATSVLGPLFAMIQSLIPNRIRAMSIAILFLFANLLGNGLGPLTVGALSDAFLPRFADESLRYALLILCPGYLWCAWHVWSARATVLADLDAAHADDLHHKPLGEVVGASAATGRQPDPEPRNV